MRWWCMPPALPRPPGCFLCLPIRPWPALTWPLFFLFFFRSARWGGRAGTSGQAGGGSSRFAEPRPDPENCTEMSNRRDLLSQARLQRPDHGAQPARGPGARAGPWSPRCPRPLQLTGRHCAKLCPSHSTLRGKRVARLHRDAYWSTAATRLIEVEGKKISGHRPSTPRTARSSTPVPGCGVTDREMSPSSGLAISILWTISE